MTGSTYENWIIPEILRRASVGTHRSDLENPILCFILMHRKIRNQSSWANRMNFSYNVEFQQPSPIVLAAVRKANTVMRRSSLVRR